MISIFVLFIVLLVQQRENFWHKVIYVRKYMKFKTITNEISKDRIVFLVFPKMVYKLICSRLFPDDDPSPDCRVQKI